jgi:hypothetical protein
MLCEAVGPPAIHVVDQAANAYFACPEFIYNSRMKIRFRLFIVAAVLVATGCVARETKDSAGEKSSSAPVAAQAPPVDLPPAGEPLTDFSSCKVEVTGIPATMKAGSGPFTVKVTVTNSSKVTWPAATAGKSNIRAVAIGYHINEDKGAGTNWLIEGNHVLLPSSLVPGGSATVDVPIVPPNKTGSFVLFIEPVQETVAWFSNKDGCVHSTPIKVN